MHNVNEDPTAIGSLLASIDTAILADGCGVTERAARGWKSGASLPSPSYLPMIAQAAMVPIRELREAFAKDAFARRNDRKRRRLEKAGIAVL
jgi:transcriptional regulator with XRE-family HTH domain